MKAYLHKQVENMSESWTQGGCSCCKSSVLKTFHISNLYVTNCNNE